MDNIDCECQDRERLPGIRVRITQGLPTCQVRSIRAAAGRAATPPHPRRLRAAGTGEDSSLSRDPFPDLEGACLQHVAADMRACRL